MCKIFLEKKEQVYHDLDFSEKLIKEQIDSIEKRIKKYRMALAGKDDFSLAISILEDKLNHDTSILNDNIRFFRNKEEVKEMLEDLEEKKDE